MELRQLRYFEAVARTLNFSRAAEELHIAQPPLSRQIQNLEDELEVQLIDRTNRPIRLTSAGSYFYDQVSQLTARLVEITDATRRVASENKQWMGVGFVPTTLYGGVPQFIQQWRERNPQVEVSLLELTSLEQAKALKSGKIDVGINRVAIADDSITNVLLSEEKLIAVVSAASPLAEQSSVRLQDLLSQTLILYPANPRPSFADHIVRQFQVRGLTVRDTYETNGVQAAIGFAAAGMGVAMVPESVSILSRPDIAFLPIKDEGVTTPLLASFREADSSDHLADFVAQLQVLCTASAP